MLLTYIYIYIYPPPPGRASWYTQQKFRIHRCRLLDTHIGFQYTRSNVSTYNALLSQYHLGYSNGARKLWLRYHSPYIFPAFILYFLMHLRKEPPLANFGTQQPRRHSASQRYFHRDTQRNEPHVKFLLCSSWSQSKPSRFGWGGHAAHEQCNGNIYTVLPVQIKIKKQKKNIIFVECSEL